uniref:Uncharacterized protein n=1 Tax=uncultured bacterium fosmid pJB148G3 TaxID=1478052 RepID=A0A0H3UAW7_9BACT|nr:hypothetical protein [uncultured bacterium fosmid pJB148G3]
MRELLQYLRIYIIVGNIGRIVDFMVVYLAVQARRCHCQLRIGYILQAAQSVRRGTEYNLNIGTVKQSLDHAIMTACVLLQTEYTAIARKAAHEYALVVGLDRMGILQYGFAYLVGQKTPVIHDILIFFAQQQTVLSFFRFRVGRQSAVRVARPFPKCRFLQWMIAHVIRIIPFACAARADIYRVQLFGIFPVKEFQYVTDTAFCRFTPCLTAARLGDMIKAVRAFGMLLQKPVAGIQLQNQRKIIIRGIFQELIDLRPHDIPIVYAVAQPKFAELRIRYAQRTQYAARIDAHQPYAALGKFARNIGSRPEGTERYRRDNLSVDFDFRDTILIDNLCVHVFSSIF